MNQKISFEDLPLLPFDKQKMACKDRSIRQLSISVRYEHELPANLIRLQEVWDKRYKDTIANYYKKGLMLAALEF